MQIAGALQAIDDAFGGMFVAPRAMASTPRAMAPAKEARTPRTVTIAKRAVEIRCDKQLESECILVRMQNVITQVERADCTHLLVYAPNMDKKTAEYRTLYVRLNQLLDQSVGRGMSSIIKYVYD